MIQVGKKMGKQPLDDAIMDVLQKKRISPEEAYDKCIDKKQIPAVPQDAAGRAEPVGGPRCATKSMTS